MEILKSIKAWINSHQGLEDHVCQHKLGYPAKVYVIVEGERKIIPDTEIHIQKPTLEIILEAILQTEEKNKHSQETIESKQ